MMLHQRSPFVPSMNSFRQLKKYGGGSMFRGLECFDMMKDSSSHDSQHFTLPYTQGFQSAPQNCEEIPTQEQNVCELETDELNFEDIIISKEDQKRIEEKKKLLDQLDNPQELRDFEKHNADEDDIIAPTQCDNGNAAEQVKKLSMFKGHASYYNTSILNIFGPQ